MKSFLILLVSAMLAFGCFGTSLEDMSKNEDSSPRFPCPEPGDITPCLCTEETGGLLLNCSAVESNSQLAGVFQAYFPVQEFYQFYIYNNYAVTVLGHGLNNVKFRSIHVEKSNVNLVSDSFILETAQTLRELIFRQTMLTENSISLSVLRDVINLEQVHIENNDGFRWITPFSSQSISTVHFYGNSIADLDSGTFDGITQPTEINVANNRLTELKTNSFTVTPLLTLIYLYGNAINVVEPNTFVVQDTVTEASLDIHLEYNLVKELHKESFGNVFPYLNLLYIHDNPLLCGCDIAWIITNPDYISKIDPNATCQDDKNLHDLDPAVYLEYC